MGESRGPRSVVQTSLWFGGDYNPSAMAEHRHRRRLATDGASRRQHRHVAGVRLGLAPPGQGPLRVRLAGSSARTSRRPGTSGSSWPRPRRRSRRGCRRHTRRSCRSTPPVGGAVTAAGATTARHRRRISRHRRRSPSTARRALPRVPRAAALAREQRVRPGVLLRRVSVRVRELAGRPLRRPRRVERSMGHDRVGPHGVRLVRDRTPVGAQLDGEHPGRDRELRAQPERGARPRPVRVAAVCCAAT